MQLGSFSFNSVRKSFRDQPTSTSFTASITLPWKLVTFHDPFNLQSCHHSSRSLQSTMNYYGIFDQFFFSKLYPRSMRKSSLHFLLITPLSSTTLKNRCNPRRNAFRVARELVFAFTTIYMLFATVVLWFNYWHCRS